MYKVEGDFDCNHNNLTSLKGAPKSVDGDFDCSFNNLTSLEGAPTKVGGNFSCHNQKNGHTFTESEIRDVCVVGGKVYV